MKWWEPDAMNLIFWMLSFKPTFWLSSFTFTKRLFNSSSLSAIRLVSSDYLRLLIFLPAALIPACASSSLAFLMMYYAYKLNKQGVNTQPWCTPFPIWYLVCNKAGFEPGSWAIRHMSLIVTLYSWGQLNLESVFREDSLWALWEVESERPGSQSIIHQHLQ